MDLLECVSLAASSYIRGELRVARMLEGESLGKFSLEVLFQYGIAPIPGGFEYSGGDDHVRAKGLVCMLWSDMRQKEGRPSVSSVMNLAVQSIS